MYIYAIIHCCSGSVTETVKTLDLTVEYAFQLKAYI